MKFNIKHYESKLLYNQRNKDETIMSVIKRLFGEHKSCILVLQMDDITAFLGFLGGVVRGILTVLVNNILQHRKRPIIEINKSNKDISVRRFELRDANEIPRYGKVAV
jgi:hypothetical protein